MQSTEFIQDLAVVMLVAGLLGWIAQRLGLSSVAGYLLAGIIVGPGTPPFTLVTDAGRIATLAQVGLVFLMFSIGLKLSLRRLRRLGPALLLAVALNACVIYYFVRVVGVFAGFGGMQALFLAAMLMVSSSAIIAKVLQETGTSHERSGQLAMGITVLEDVVAVVMLTLLNSAVHMSGASGVAGADATQGGGGGSVLATVGLLAAFVVLTGIVGLLLVPWLLRRMSVVAGEELQTLGTAGLLFGLALLAEKAGYSLALGAFLLGTIVAETPHRHQIERIFEGMRDVFSAVFFVAIGLQIDARDLIAEWQLIAGVTLLTVIGRPLAATVGLVLTGTAQRDAMRAGLALTPIGEFSFIIAQLGVAALVVPPAFYPMAVGLSLATSLIAPWLTRHAGPLSAWVIARQPRWLESAVRYYHEWLERAMARGRRNLLWQLSRKRLIQIGVEVLLVTGILVFAEQGLGWFEGRVGPDWLFPSGPVVIFWSVLFLVLLAPLVAIWRNASALAMIFAEVATAGRPAAQAREIARVRHVVLTGLKVAIAAAMWLWLSALVPWGGVGRWVLLAGALAGVAALVLLRRRLVFWHSELEVELQGYLATGGAASGGSMTNVPFLQAHAEWPLAVVDCTVPDLAECAGQSIATMQLRSRFGCTVVGIERQGVLIPLPGPHRELFPRDRVLLMGAGEQVTQGRDFLLRVAGSAPASDFDELSMEKVEVPPGSVLVGQTLAELALGRDHAVQVAGIERAGTRILSPSGDERVRPADRLLVLGAATQTARFGVWVRGSAEEAQTV